MDFAFYETLRLRLFLIYNFVIYLIFFLTLNIQNFITLWNLIIFGSKCLGVMLLLIMLPVLHLLRIHTTLVYLWALLLLLPLKLISLILQLLVFQILPPLILTWFLNLAITLLTPFPSVQKCPWRINLVTNALIASVLSNILLMTYFISLL